MNKDKVHPDNEKPEINLLTNHLLEVLDNFPNENELPFILKHLRDVLLNSTNKVSNQNRWCNEMIAFAKTVRYYSGKSGLELLNGILGTKDNKSNNLFNVTFGLPSVSTCVNHSRPINFKPGYNEQTEKLVEGIIKKHSGGKIRGMLIADETVIIPGFLHQDDYGLIGSVWNKEVKEKGFANADKEVLKDSAAKQVFQIFFCSFEQDILTYLPLCFYPTKKANAKEVKEIFKEVIDKLSEKGIEIEMTITDGFLNPSFNLQVETSIPSQSSPSQSFLSQSVSSQTSPSQCDPSQTSPSQCDSSQIYSFSV